MTAALSLMDGQLLARLAAGAVRAWLLGERFTARIPPAGSLHEPSASFVTLERAGALRGCVGTLQPVRALHRDVVHNANRAMTDPRLPPVTTADWPELDVKVSVLTVPAELPTEGPEQLAAALQPGVHGLLLADGERRATFLPSVWEKIADPERFVAALLRKGGWAGWPAGITARAYRSVEFTDRSPRLPL